MGKCQQNFSLEILDIWILSLSQVGYWLTHGPREDLVGLKVSLVQGARLHLSNCNVHYNANSLARPDQVGTWSPGEFFESFLFVKLSTGVGLFDFNPLELNQP